MKMRIFAALFLAIAASIPPQTFGASADQPANKPVYDVRAFGAKGDGATLDTAAIAAAIRAASEAGGGRVIFSPGTYLTGTFELLSNVTLDLEAGAVIEGSKNLADYGSTESFGLGKVYGVNSSGEGNLVGIIIARNVENVGIVGHGVIDGNGDAFFDFTKPHFSMDFDPRYTRQGNRFLEAVRQTGDGPVLMKPEGRPGTMIICFNCRNVVIRDVTLRNAPNWTIHFNDTERAVVSGLHVVNNPLLPNNDGFDCFGCREVHFSDCDINTGDDDFAIVNSSDVGIDNCSLTSRSSGIRLEATRYSTFQNLTIHANRGIGIYERGVGRTDHLLFSNLAIETQLFTGHWWGKGEPIYVVAAKPKSGADSGRISDVHFSNVTGEAESSVILYGSPEAPLRDIYFTDVHFTFRRTRKEVSDAVGGNYDFRWTATDLSNAVFKHDIPGVYGRYVEGIHLRDVSVRWGREVPDFFTGAIQLEDFKDLDIDGFQGKQAGNSAAPVISLLRGSGVSIRNSKADAGTGVFLWASGVSEERLFTGNDVVNANRVFSGELSRFNSYGNYFPRAQSTKKR